MESKSFKDVKMRLQELEIEDLPDEKKGVNLSIEHISLLSDILREIKVLSRNQRIIKGILVFFCVLTIIGLVVELIIGIYVATNVYKLYNIIH